MGGWLLGMGLVLGVAGVMEGLAWLDMRAARRREQDAADEYPVTVPGERLGKVKDEERRWGR